MDEYFRVSAIFNLTGSDADSGYAAPYQSCDELKQNQAAHTKMRVYTLS